jgi:cytochrome c553
MRKKIRLSAALAAVCCFSLVGGVQAQDGGDPAAGEAKAALCAGCHGGDGNSMSAEFPRLASQYEGYIVKQIVDFQ